MIHFENYSYILDEKCITHIEGVYTCDTFFPSTNINNIITKS